MRFIELSRNRYSCKSFSDKRIKSEDLELILEAGKNAPTAKNLQPQHIYVLESSEALAKLDSATPCRYNAKTVLVVAFNKFNVFTYPGGKRDSGIEDATIIATHMMLEAADLGIDSCWVNFFDPEDLKNKLSLPDEEEILMVLDLGYKSETAGPLPNHNSRKDLKDTVTKM